MKKDGGNFSCHSAVWFQVPGPFTRYRWSSLWSRPFWFPGPRPKNSWIGSFATSKRTLDRRGWAAEPCWELGFDVSKPNLKIGSRFSRHTLYVDQFGGLKPFRKGSISNVHPFSSIFQNLYYRHKMVITCNYMLLALAGASQLLTPFGCSRIKSGGLSP